MRVLRYHGIQQPDWHLNQILVTKLEELEFDFVLVDFAFAILRRDRLEGDYVAPFGGEQRLARILFEGTGKFDLFTVHSDVFFSLDGYET